MFFSSSLFLIIHIIYCNYRLQAKVEALDFEVEQAAEHELFQNS
jgi:hypothetical protein